MFVRRYVGFYAALIALTATGTLYLRGMVGWGWMSGCLAVCLLDIHDISQRRHSILRNYPILGHFRFLFEFIRPELRQYIVESAIWRRA